MNKKDKFEDFLAAELSAEAAYWRTRALTARSYKSIDPDLTPQDINDELATYGDALLKFALCEFLLDDKDPTGLSVTKVRYESDRVLVDKVARHYDLLKYLRFDRRNSRIPQNYDYKDDGHKYIATALEALLGAHFKIYRDLSATKEIVRKWMDIVEGEKV